MHPLLIQLGPLPIHTYGFLIAVGFLVALSVIKRLAVKSQLNPEKILDLCFWSLMIGFLGSRVLFVITRWQDFSRDWLGIFRVWEGGLVFLGGPIAVIPFLVWYLKKHKLPMWKALDAMIPGLVIAHMFGRFGCLSAGCCYGKPTNGNWGIKFYSDLVDRHLHGVSLHPTQLYEASALFLLFSALLWVFRHKKFDGQVFLTYLMAYPIIRSIIEVFRGDTIRGFVIDDVLSTSQFLSILIFLGASAALYQRLKAVHLKKTG